jgi:hypothetical protein
VVFYGLFSSLHLCHRLNPTANKKAAERAAGNLAAEDEIVCLPYLRFDMIIINEKC